MCPIGWFEYFRNGCCQQSIVFTEFTQKGCKNNKNMTQFCRWKWLVDQKRMARLVWADREANLTQIITLHYNHGEKKRISKQNLRWMASTPVSNEHESDATMGTDSQKVDCWLEKRDVAVLQYVTGCFDNCINKQGYRCSFQKVFLSKARRKQNRRQAMVRRSTNNMN